MRIILPSCHGASSIRIHTASLLLLCHKPAAMGAMMGAVMGGFVGGIGNGVHKPVRSGEASEADHSSADRRVDSAGV